MRIRPATPQDRAWILALAPRLHAFGPPGPPPWRPLVQMDRAVARGLERVLEAPSPTAQILIAEGPGPESLGFMHVHTATDFFTGEVHTHISDLVVAQAAEGRGVGRALLEAAEAWARERGHRLLTLNVFPTNRRALAVYERAGFAPDTMKLVKAL